MKLEILSDFKHSGDRFTKGEIRQVDDAVGEYFCRAGWVKDMSGAVATATPGPNDVVLRVNKVSQVTKAGEV